MIARIGSLGWTMGAAAVFAVIVASLELVIRSLASRFPKPLDWHAWEAQHKVAAMQALAAEGGASVAFFGASDVNAAADPDALTSMLGSSRPAFNAALNGATMRTLEPWALSVVLPYLKPDLVVLGLHTYALNDGSYGGKRGANKFRRSCGWQRHCPTPSPPQRLLLSLERHLYLIRYRRFLFEPTIARRRRFFRIRRFLSDPRYLFHTTRGNHATVSRLGVLDALWIFSGEGYSIPERMRAVWEEQYLNDYRVGGEELAAFRRFVNGVRASGAELLVILVPVTADWTALHPHGQRDEDDFLQLLDSTIAEAEIPFLDMNAEFTRLGHVEYFADPVHLNVNGRRYFTEGCFPRIQGLVVPDDPFALQRKPSV